MFGRDNEEHDYYEVSLIVHCHVFFSCADDGDESFNDHEDGNGSKDYFREQDIYLPIANVARIMKNAIPQTGKVISGNFKNVSWYRELIITIIITVFNIFY